MSPGSRLGPYEILARIGVGSMGTVWKARDTRLDRLVAVKEVGRKHLERITQEARAIAALNHPHICQIYDLGPNYLVLEFIEGKPLKGPIPDDEAAALTLQVAGALEEAHKVGILHRDLKPENIMVTPRGVKLLDFGLAKVPSSEAFSPIRTMSGTVVGTPAYMSPEQAQGDPIDQRSDIFSLGAVMYEMLSGKRAFGGVTLVETLISVVKDEPPPLDSPLFPVIRRCLAKDRARRYATAKELRRALEEVEFDSEATVVMQMPHSTATSKIAEWSTAASILASSANLDPFSDSRTIAVLPLVNISPHSEDEYLCDGLAEELINGLTQIGYLRVVSRSSSFQCKGTTPDVREIGRRLRARLLVHGSLRRLGDSLRLTMQLSDAYEGYQLWSERFDASMQDLFALQDQLTAAVLERLREQLGSRLGSLQVRMPDANAEAYPLYLKGRFAFNQETAASLRLALKLFQDALQADPNFAPALVGVAETYMRLEWYGLEPAREAVERAKAALETALRLEPNAATARCLLAVIQAGCDWDWESAGANFVLALAHGAGIVSVHFHYALDLLTPQGHLDEALREIRLAARLDPLSPITGTAVGGCYYRLRRWDEAARSLRETLGMHPNFGHVHWSLGRVLLEQRAWDEAIQNFEEAARIMGQTAGALAELGYGYARAGRVEEGRRVLHQLLEISSREWVSPIHPALVYAGLGDSDEALSCLEKAFQQRVRQLVWVNADPRFDSLRETAGFQDLIGRMGLPRSTSVNGGEEPES